MWCSVRSFSLAQAGAGAVPSAPISEIRSSHKPSHDQSFRLVINLPPNLRNSSRKQKAIGRCGTKLSDEQRSFNP